MIDTDTSVASHTETDPFAWFQRWMAEAEASEPSDPNAMTVVTVGAGGRPSARTILLKGVDPRGFVFYTNTHSRKGDELAANQQISLLFYWKSLGRQIRIEGSVERVTDAEADAYYATRPRISRLGAWLRTSPGRLPNARSWNGGWRRWKKNTPARTFPARRTGTATAAAGAVRILAEHAVPPARPDDLRARGAGGRRLDARQTVPLTA